MKRFVYYTLSLFTVFLLFFLPKTTAHAAPVEIEEVWSPEDRTSVQVGDTIHLCVRVKNPEDFNSGEALFNAEPSIIFPLTLDPSDNVLKGEFIVPEVKRDLKLTLWHITIFSNDDEQTDKFWQSNTWWSDAIIMFVHDIWDISDIRVEEDGKSIGENGSVHVSFIATQNGESVPLQRWGTNAIVLLGYPTDEPTPYYPEEGAIFQENVWDGFVRCRYDETSQRNEVTIPAKYLRDATYTKVMIWEVSSIGLIKEGISVKVNKSGGQQEHFSSHVHSFQWKQMTEATETEDALYAYECTACGAVGEYAHIPNSAYAEFNLNTANKVSTAASGEIVKAETRLWMSFYSPVITALSNRPDVALTVEYQDHGKVFAVTIPAGTDIKALADENGYIGFLYLSSQFGSTPK